MPKTEPQTTDATTASDVPKTTPNQARPAAEWASSSSPFPGR